VLIYLCLQCSVTWMQGATVAINWLLPPPGNVSIALASNTGGAVYTISPSYPSISQAGYCDSGYGLGTVAPGVLCGRVEFVVPGGWVKAANCQSASSSHPSPASPSAWVESSFGLEVSSVPGV
jgi:hypothetical protein